MSDSIDNKDSDTATLEDIAMSRALYLDGMYIQNKVVELVINNAKADGLISNKTSKDDKNYQWVVHMAEHHMLILKLQDRAKGKTYTPMGMECINNHALEIVRKISKAMADTLMLYYPPKK
ncbi:hypothetical protein ACT0HV_003940 [Vibrio diabolicus]